jgi:hypothetical protein
MFIGRDTLFGSALFVAPKAQGMVSSLVLRSPSCSDSHFFLTFFRWLEANRAERGDGSRARGLCAFIGAQRRPLTRLPRSVHSPAKKWEISPALFFSTRLRAFAARSLGSTRSRGFSFLAACFLQVRAR